MAGFTRVLLYGFGPYRQFRRNITASIIKSLPPARRLKRVVFTVRFDRRQFVKALERHKPDVVLGLGQSSRRTIELEIRAANRRRTGVKAKVRPIRKGGPRWLPTTLNLKIGGRIKRSKNAGDYVCNYSMYVMLEELRRTDAKTPFGFIHIPHDFPQAAARRAVLDGLKQLRHRTSD
jgi:pyrrolidone-carboxylate peptidase